MGNHTGRWCGRGILLVCLIGLIWLVFSLTQNARVLNRSLGLSVIRLQQAVTVEEAKKLRKGWEEKQARQGEYSENQAAGGGQEGAAVFPAVFWQEQKNAVVSNAWWGRGTSVTVLTLYGSSSLLFPEQAYLDETDRDGCLIDQNTSWNLFGDENAVGQEVEYQGKTYLVRGILKEDGAVFVCMAGEQSDSFSCAALSEDSGRTLWEYLQSRGGLQGRESVRYQWNPAWLWEEGSMRDRLREILYGENNVAEIRYLECGGRILAEAAGVMALAGFSVMSGVSAGQRRRKP